MPVIAAQDIIIIRPIIIIIDIVWHRQSDTFLYNVYIVTFTPTWGIVRHHRTNTSSSQLLYEIWNLWLWLFQRYFRGLSGMTCRPQAGTCYFNLPTKIEASNNTHYEDMKSGAKYTTWGSLGRSGVTQSHGQCHHPIERIWLPIRL